MVDRMIDRFSEMADLMIFINGGHFKDIIVVTTR